MGHSAFIAFVFDLGLCLFSDQDCAVPVTGPVLLVLARCAIGAAVMLGLLIFIRNPSWPKTAKQWAGLIGVGIISTALPFYLISYAEEEISSGMTAILMTTGPLVVIVLGHFFTEDEKINRGKVLGIFMGLGAALYLLKDGFDGFGSAGILHLHYGVGGGDLLCNWRIGCQETGRCFRRSDRCNGAGFFCHCDGAFCDWVRY